MVLVSLATVERRRGRCTEALKLVGQSLELGQQLAWEEISLYCLLELAALLARHGDAEEAARLHGASEAVMEKLGVALPAPDEETRAETLAAVEAVLGGTRAPGRWPPEDAQAAMRRSSAGCRSCARLSRS